MELNVADRMSLLSILPPQGDITTLRIVRELREALSFTEAELTDFGIVTEGQTVHWDGANNGVKEVDIGPKATDIIVTNLKAKDHEQALTESHLPLWDKFIGK